jgi:hypothetical protein
MKHSEFKQTFYLDVLQIRRALVGGTRHPRACSRSVAVFSDPPLYKNRSTTATALLLFLIHVDLSLCYSLLMRIYVYTIGSEIADG